MIRRRVALALALAATGTLGTLPSAAAQPGHAERVEHHDVTAPPSRGPANALVTIEVFFSPTVSMRGIKAVEELQAQHPSRIRLVYRVVSGGGSAMLPSALLEAQAQGKFFELLDAIQNRSVRAWDRASLIEVVARVGLDVHRVAIAMQHGSEALDENTARLHRFGRSPPDVLFNGVPLDRPLNAADLGAAYRAAYERAQDFVDRGADPSTLADAFEQEALENVNAEVQPSGDTDDEVDVEPAEPPLASPPLALAGLPTFGRVDAPIPIVLLCSPSSTKCRASIDHAMDVQRVYPDDVRVVWAPWYDVTRADAIELGLLADAALCAEAVGTSSTADNDVSSSGWRWVAAVLDATFARHGRRVPAVDIIDATAKTLHVDPRAFAACRAGRAGAAVARIAAARHSGVRGAPTVVVGGRLYLRGLPDSMSLQRLVEAELAPGVLGQLAPPGSARRRPAPRHVDPLHAACYPRDAMELTFAAATDVGRQRTSNEDNFLIDKKLRLFLVADGMGGHAAGEVASSIAVHGIRDAVHNEPRADRALSRRPPRRPDLRDSPGPRARGAGGVRRGPRARAGRARQARHGHDHDGVADRGRGRSPARLHRARRRLALLPRAPEPEPHLDRGSLADERAGPPRQAQPRADR